MIKKWGASLFTIVKGDHILYSINKTPRVLFWHSVDYIKDSRIEAEGVDFSVFKKQIKYLMKKFEIISIDQYYDRFINNKYTGREVVLTFDDGYKNNYSIIAPFLEKFSIPFTVFISTNKITNGDLFPPSLLRLIIWGSSAKKINIKSLNQSFNISTQKKKNETNIFLSKKLKILPLDKVEIICQELMMNITADELYDLRMKYSSIIPMTWFDVRDILKYNCTIGSHCMDHICCHEAQDPLIIKQQITESKKIIEKNLGFDCKYIAYPNGNYTDLSNDYVLSAGYHMGFSTKPYKIHFKNKAIIPRICIPNSYDLMKMKINLYPIK